MATVERPTGVRTHEVTNQAPPLTDYNVFEADRALVEAVRREGADWAERADLAEVGEFAGRASAIELGRLANENPPKLRTHDRYGNRVDEVEFHPAWHELMRLGVGHELHSLPWREPQPGAHVARGAAFMCFSPGRGRGRLPDLDDLLGDPGAAHQPELAAEWEPRFLSSAYDPRATSRGREARRARRDGDDREAGRLRRARQHHGRPRRSTAAAPAPSTSSPATSGSSRRRCATRSSSSPRPTAASPASCSRAGRPTASATASASSA